MNFLHNVFAHHPGTSASNVMTLGYTTTKQHQHSAEQFLDRLRESISSFTAGIKASFHSHPLGSNDQDSSMQSNVDRLIEEAGLVDLTTLQDFKNNGLLSKFPRYLATVSDRIEHLEALIAEKNLDEIQKVMHALIGPTGMMGAVALCSYIAELDGWVKREACWPSDPSWIKTIKQLYAMTAAAMQPHLDAA
jgi:hypothetical protein